MCYRTDGQMLDGQTGVFVELLPQLQMSQKVERVQKGGRGQHKKSKSPTFEFGLFDTRGGGGYILIFFPNVNCKTNKK